MEKTKRCLPTQRALKSSSRLRECEAHLAVLCTVSAMCIIARLRITMRRIFSRMLCRTIRQLPLPQKGSPLLGWGIRRGSGSIVNLHTALNVYEVTILPSIVCLQVLIPLYRIPFFCLFVLLLRESHCLR